jgi:hypothetical protein
MLAGASYLDLLLGYNISQIMLYDLFHEVVRWINGSFHFPLPTFIKEENTEKLNQISLLFSDKSDGIITGCIGAIDGLAIRIQSPVIHQDNVPDPGNYYCRKGFFALNVQAICDSKKRILWMSSGHKGSTHDSAAFAETGMSALLQRKKEYLYKNRFFIVADSAYSLQSYMIVPYNNAEANSIEDSFNYYQSKTRIYIECAFGEIVMRWGIFWRRLNYKLNNIGPIINACCYLHNFLVDERLRCSDYEKEDSDFFKNFDHKIDDSQRYTNNETAFPLVTDNNEPSKGGRPGLCIEGNDIRNNLAANLRTFDMIRPTQEGTKVNSYGNVYTT